MIESDQPNIFCSIPSVAQGDGKTAEKENKYLRAVLGSGTVSTGAVILDRFIKNPRVPKPKPRRPVLTPIERDKRGFFMTLCIAAIAAETNTIVTVSDFMLSSQTSSTEASVTKLSPTGQTGRWLMMYSGDPSSAYLVWRNVNTRLSETETESEIIAAYTSAIQDEIKKKVENELLSAYGWTREEFMRDGRQSLGDEQFARLLYRVQNTGLETDFIVTGFTGIGSCHIYSFHDPGTCVVHDPLRFHCIGCGAALADASLLSSFRSRGSLTDVVYRLAEAKFIGESAPGVGKQTLITTLNFEEKVIRQAIHPTKVEAIKGLWEMRGRPLIPDEAKGMIEKLFKPVD